MIIRLILLALGQTAVCTKSAVVSTDPEQLALLSGTEPETAVAAVQTLLHDNDPLIVPAPPQASPLAAPAQRCHDRGQHLIRRRPLFTGHTQTLCAANAHRALPATPARRLDLTQ